MVPLRKWYFAVDERGARRAAGLVRVAVRSCLAHTPLAPHLLYHGAEVPLLDELRGLGVTVIRRPPSLERELRTGYGADAYDQFVGHWLRLDIPDIETEDEFVLYTDIDVLFRPLPPVLPAPRLLSVGPAQERTERKRFNSGVMVMNLPALRPLWPDFLAAVRARLLGDFRYPTHDQASFNAFFGGRIEWLADEMNWRPYWGDAADAHIVHFHGPKPARIRQLMAGETADDGPLTALWRRAPEAYARYVDLFERHAGTGPVERSAAGPVMIGPPQPARQPGPLARLLRRS